MSSATKIVGIYLLSWRTGFNLGLGFLLLIIPALSAVVLSDKAIAQADTKLPAVKPAAQETNQSNKTPQVAPGLEPAILTEINRVRTDPQGYAQWLESQRQYYDGIWLRLPGEKPMRTNKGKKALEEAIALLKEQPPLAPLEISTATANKATAELENFATANNIQYFSYGRQTALGIVMDLVVDDLFPDRRRRQSLLSPNAEDTGVICKPDPRYAKVCAIAYSDSPPTDLAAAPTPSQANVDTNTVVADVPEIIVPAEPDSNPVPSANIEPETVENENTSATGESDLNEAEEKRELATLPVPPVPQAPPKPSVEPEKPVTSATASDLELTEPETKTATATEDIELESEDTAAASNNTAVESESATVATPPESEPEAESSEPEATEEAESSTVTEAPTEAVATKPANDRLLQKVERGSLEEGDRIIAEDGSLYDFYPLIGKAGDAYTIYLESDEFDAFVALVDSNGNTIKENDDISEENSNSRIRVTLPEDGTYNIIVNTYDEKGTGKYILTLSR